MDVVPYDFAIAKTAGAPSQTYAWIDFSAQQNKKGFAWLRSNPVGRFFVSSPFGVLSPHGRENLESSLADQDMDKHFGRATIV